MFRVQETLAQTGSAAIGSQGDAGGESSASDSCSDAARLPNSFFLSGETTTLLLAFLQLLGDLKITARQSGPCRVLNREPISGYAQNACFTVGTLVLTV